LNPELGAGRLDLEMVDPQSTQWMAAFGEWSAECCGGLIELYATIDGRAAVKESIRHCEFLEGVRELGLFSKEGLPPELASQEQLQRHVLPVLDPWGVGYILQEDLLILERDPLRRRAMRRRLESAKEERNACSAPRGARRPRPPPADMVVPAVGSQASSLLFGLVKKTTALGGRHWKQLELEQPRELAEARNPKQTRLAGAAPSAPSAPAAPPAPGAAARAGRRRRSPRQGGRRSVSCSPSMPDLGSSKEADAQGSEGALPRIAGAAAAEAPAGCSPAPAKLGQSVSLPELPVAGRSAMAEEAAAAQAQAAEAAGKHRKSVRRVYGRKVGSCLPAMGGAPVAPLHWRPGPSLGGAGKARKQVDGALLGRPARCEDFFRQEGARQLYAQYYESGGAQRISSL